MANKEYKSKYVIEGENRTDKAFKGVQSNLQDLASSAAILEGPLGTVAGRINALGAALGRMNLAALAAGVSISSLSVGAIAAVREANKLEEQTLRMEAVLKATGDASGYTSGQLNEMALALAQNTLASQEGARDAIVSLLSFNNVSREVFGDTLELAQDLTAVFKGDLRSNIVRLGRALDNPREGLQGLSRQITAFDSDTRQMISTMFESGDVLGAQTKIIETLKDRVGGAGAAAGGGLAGAIDTLGENWTFFLAKVGETTGLLGAATTAFKELGALVGNYNEKVLDPSPTLQLERLLPKLDELEAQYESLNKSIRPDVNKTIFNHAADGAKEFLDSMREGRPIFANVVKDLLETRHKVDELTYVLILEAEQINNAAVKSKELAEEKRQLAIAISYAEAAQKRQNELLKENTSLLQSIITPQEQWDESIKSVTKQLEYGLLTADQYDRAINKIQNTLRKGLGMQDQNESKADFDRLTSQLATPNEAIENTYNDRLFIIENALQDELINHQRHSELIQQIEDDKNKSLLALEAQKNDAMATAASDIYGSLAQIVGQGSKKAFNAWKALSYAQTLVSTFSAAQKAFESQFIPGDPTSMGRAILAGSSAVLAGLARAAAIQRTQFNAGGSASAGGAGSGSSFGGGGSGPASIGSRPSAPTQIGSGSSSVININVTGNVIGDDLRQIVSDALRDADRDDIIQISFGGIRAEVS